MDIYQIYILKDLDKYLTSLAFNFFLFSLLLFLLQLFLPMLIIIFLECVSLGEDGKIFSTFWTLGFDDYPLPRVANKEDKYFSFFSFLLFSSYSFSASYLYL